MPQGGQEQGEGWKARERTWGLPDHGGGARSCFAWCLGRGRADEQAGALCVVGRSVGVGGAFKVSGAIGVGLAGSGAVAGSGGR